MATDKHVGSAALVLFLTALPVGTSAWADVDGCTFPKVENGKRRDGAVRIGIAELKPLAGLPDEGIASTATQVLIASVRSFLDEQVPQNLKGRRYRFIWEAEPLGCVIQSHGEARIVAHRLDLDLIIWGDASHRPTVRVEGEITVSATLGSLSMSDNARFTGSSIEVQATPPEHVVFRATMNHPLGRLHASGAPVGSLDRLAVVAIGTEPPISLLNLVVALHFVAQEEPWHAVPFFLRVDEFGGPDGRTERALRSLWKAYALSHAPGRASEAIAVAESALEIVAAEGSQIEVMALNVLAHASLAAGRPRMAQEHYERAIQISNDGGLLPDTMAILENNLASAFFAQGDFGRAQELWHASRIRGRALLGERFEGTVYTNLGVVLERLGRWSEAEVYHRDALILHRASDGLEGPRTAHALSNLGGFLVSVGKVEEGVPMLQSALRIHRSTVGEDSLPVAHTMERLALAAAVRGNDKEAHRLYQESFEVCRRSLGDQHPDTAVLQNNLGQFLLDKGRPKEALFHFEAALKALRGGAETDSRYLTAVLNNAAQAQARLKQLAAAEALFKEALRIDQEMTGPDSYETARDLNNLGEFELYRRDWARAVEYFESAHHLMEARRGNDSPETQIVQENLAIARAAASGRRGEEGCIVVVARCVAGTQAPDFQVGDWLREVGPVLLRNPAHCKDVIAQSDGTAIKVIRAGKQRTVEHIANCELEFR